MDTASLIAALITVLDIVPHKVDALRGVVFALDDAATNPSHADPRFVTLLQCLRREPLLKIFDDHV